jgi:transcriptional regulator with XRE-family HTH domain
MPTNADLGCAVRRLRRARRISIETLAFDADIHPTYLSGIERGVRNPTWDKLTALAHALDIPMSALVQGAELQAQLAAQIREACRDLGMSEPTTVIDLDQFEVARRDSRTGRSWYRRPQKASASNAKDGSAGRAARAVLTTSKVAPHASAARSA